MAPVRQIDPRVLALARVEDVVSRGPPPPISSTYPCIRLGPPVFGPHTKDETEIREAVRQFMMDEVRAALAQRA